MLGALRVLANQLKTIAVVTGFLSLLTLNVLTLIDDGIHAKAYSVLESIVQSAKAGAMIKNSPMEVRRHDVAIATQALRSERDDLARKTAQLVAVRNNLISDVNTLQAEKTRVEALVRTWETKYSHARAETQRFSRRVAERLVKGASRSVALLGGKAVPVFGIAVTVAATGLDLKDACDTIRETNELALSPEENETDESKVCGLSVPTKEAVAASVSTSLKRSYMEAAEVLEQYGTKIPPLPSAAEASKAAMAYFVGGIPGLLLWHSMTDQGKESLKNKLCSLGDGVEARGKSGGALN